MPVTLPRVYNSRNQGGRLTGHNQGGKVSDMDKPDEASAPEGFDLGREMFRLANLVQPQPAIMTLVDQKKISAVLAAYEQALADPAARIPTMLHLAIEGLK